MTKHEAAQETGIPPGQLKIVLLAGVEVGLFRLATGEWRAYRNFCPHMGAPVCAGRVSAGERPTVRCPWHAWDFDLATGELVGDPDCQLDSYRVEVAEGTVFVWMREMTNDSRVCETAEGK